MSSDDQRTKCIALALGDANARSGHVLLENTSNRHQNVAKGLDSIGKHSVKYNESLLEDPCDILKDQHYLVDS